MSYMGEYIKKGYGAKDFEAELQRLITEYNKLQGTYLFLYASAISKSIPQNQLDQSDYYVIQDLLRTKKGLNKLDFYIQTLGGRGEAAEEIVRFLHSNFGSITFIVAGEAKSAGTIIVLSGNEIMMTETGSLGPIDAQMTIGRSQISAYDYMEWVEQKREEAKNAGSLNPFDATMIAQITPGELGSVFHSLKFAEDLVIEWLVDYKFKNWDTTESRGLPVSTEMKKERAENIAKELTKHSRWRSHGRSLKISDLVNEIQLKIIRIDDNPKLADIVYRIHTVLGLLFDSTTAYKIFATQDNRIVKHATPVGAPPVLSQLAKANVAEINQVCPKCGKQHAFYGKFLPDPKIDKDMQQKGLKPFPKDAKFKCICGFEIDMSGVRNEVEMVTKKKIIV